MLSCTVVEPAAPHNWNEAGYLLANPDVAEHVAAGGNAHDHFVQHGAHEGRSLLTSQFINSRQDRDRRKYRRFAPILDPAPAGGGKFRNLAGENSFPVSFGTKPYEISAYDGESSNGNLSQFVEAMEANPNGRYLDLGCGFRRVLYENCLYLDVYPSLTADIIMEPACTYPIASGSLDGICCLAVLEHVEQPWTVAREIHRMLKPGGTAFIDWPFLQPVHGYPSHFYNATRFGLENLFKDGFELLALDTFPNQTPDWTVFWLLQDWLATLVSEAARTEFMGMTVRDLLAQQPSSPFWNRMLAATPSRAILTFACGNTLIARKT